MGFPGYSIHLVATYGNQESAVRTSDGDCDWFEIERGVRLCDVPGDVQHLLEEREGGITIGGVRATNLRLADGTTLLRNSKEELKRVKDISKAKRVLLNTHNHGDRQRQTKEGGFHTGWRENRRSGKLGISGIRYQHQGQ